MEVSEEREEVLVMDMERREVQVRLQTLADSMENILFMNKFYGREINRATIEFLQGELHEIRKFLS